MIGTDFERIHPRYKWAFTGAKTWRKALQEALYYQAAYGEGGKVIVYKSRADGFWWATWAIWQ
jgi:hypothetical protein